MPIPRLRHSFPFVLHYITLQSPQSSSKIKMWLTCICEGQEKELGRQQAPGSCPYCGGKVEAVDVEVQSRLCFLPMCFQIKRKYFCSLCSRRLEILLY
ncbi:uncharacterized protein [Cicer arietinum]|uniref:Uncharacterized protein LOC101511588 n=1 Tax=Cicer arietinum TaxID=3827 RepID=A0A1S3ED69_CICAR|nr:uncharacterized protein LOC101511588 [Cicer arietinum]